MSNSDAPVRRTDDRDGWATFTRRTDDPKLTWLEQQLAQRGIESRRNGHSWHAPILEVRGDRLLDAWAILETPVGELFIGGSGVVTVDDLPDDHPLFREAFLGRMVPDAPVSGGHVLPYIERVFVDSLAAGESVAPAGPGIMVRMYDVDSSNLSAMGVTPDDELNPPSSLTLYVTFKGATTYRYSPIAEATWEALHGEAVRVARGDQEASVGSTFHHMVKVYADEGVIKCERLDEEGGFWRVVPPKAQRPKRERPRGPRVDLDDERGRD
jgi:hypothetical protein